MCWIGAEVKDVARSAALAWLIQWCFTSTESTGLIRDGESRTATSTFTQLLSSVLQCCFTSTETTRLIRDGESRTATSTFTQLLSSGRVRFNAALRLQKPYGLSGTGSVHVFSCDWNWYWCLFCFCCHIQHTMFGGSVWLYGAMILSCTYVHVLYCVLFYWYLLCSHKANFYVIHRQ